MSVNTESMSLANLKRFPSFGDEVLDVAMNGVASAGIGYLCARMSKTNVVAALIIGGCQGLTEATFGKIIKHSLGEETRNAKIILAVGYCLIGTIGTIASVAFGVMSTSGAVFYGVFIFGSFGWHLFSAIKPEQAQMCTDYIEEQMRKLLPKPRPKEMQVNSSEQDESIDLFEQAAAVEVKQPKNHSEFVEIDLNEVQEPLSNVIKRTI